MLKTENTYGLSVVLTKPLICTALLVTWSPTQLKLTSVSDHCIGKLFMRVHLYQATSQCDQPASSTIAEPACEVNL